METHILLITCQDYKGLISKISTIVFENDLNILVMKEFVEEETNTFFMRSELSGFLDKDRLHAALEAILPEGAKVNINPKQKKDIVILVTKEHHCLSDLLSRHHFDQLHARIHCVIGNYNVLKDYTGRFNIPFYYVSHENKTKEQFENELYETITPHKPDYLVLAKFMRILSPDFVEKFENRIINIHHSFLPAFVGSNPYKQAYERGVKLIGATAHIVNNDLDEGPILVQKVDSVDHSCTAKSMVTIGHEVEVSVLAEALKLVLDDRVFVSGNKTIIFS
ncbi:MAG TPA: formyltetrahydrofolate deformylase [Cytophagaceae bacterium]|jgi:formyltetrahydrofolate deformylase|nr:formyltetrahydrofolate deformylase [Cytophagaceae bacterium]